jgi:hypothetical protein
MDFSLRNVAHSSARRRAGEEWIARAWPRASAAEEWLVSAWARVTASGYCHGLSRSEQLSPRRRPATPGRRGQPPSDPGGLVGAAPPLRGGDQPLLSDNLLLM